MDAGHGKPAMDDSELQPSGKRRRPLPSDDSNKVCFILYSIGEMDGGPHNNRIHYDICIVDLNSDQSGGVGVDDEYPPISPTLHIDAGIYPVPGTDAFCVLGKTLYLFESCYDLVDEFDTGSKSVFTFDLSLLDGDNVVKLGKNDLVKDGELLFPKPCSVAIPTPDGEKVVVFSSQCYITYSTYPKSSQFELYDLANRSSEPLPALDMSAWSTWMVETYGFVNNSTLLVQLHECGIYVLNLDSKCWVQKATVYCGVGRIPTFCETSLFETIWDRFCFVTSSGAYDLQRCVGPYIADARLPKPIVPPLLWLRSKPSDYGLISGDEIALDYRLVLLDHDEDKGECNFSYLGMERVIFVPQSFFRITMALCCADLKTYIREEEQQQQQMPHLDTRFARTLQFSVLLEERRNVFGPPFFFKI